MRTFAFESRSNPNALEPEQPKEQPPLTVRDTWTGLAIV
jgi:hypothetical protein